MKKILLTSLGTISDKIHSHKAAQAIIYADQLKYAGYDVTINLVSNKITDYIHFDEIFFYHGSDWSGNLNLFGGIQSYTNKQYLLALSKFKGRVNSIICDFPDYASMFEDRLTKADMKWDDIDWTNLRKLQSSAVTVNPNTIKRYSSIAFGDSHAIAMYRPEFENVSVPFSTLHGSINRGFEEFIPEGGKYDTIETYFGNIDIRHHLCRFNDPIEEARKLAQRYATEIHRISKKYSATVIAWEPLPIENESRKVPKTGWYKGTPFYGSWEERTSVRNAFIEELKKHTEVYAWTAQLTNTLGELSFNFMEKPQSVHLSRASYPHWTGKDWTQPQESGGLSDFFA